MTTKRNNGKQYEIGKYYEFSDDEDLNEEGCFSAKLKGVGEDTLYPFKASFGASYKYCREINPESLGKITKPKITPEVGKLYKVSVGGNVRFMEWDEDYVQSEMVEIICEMVEKE